jgi:transposase
MQQKNSYQRADELQPNNNISFPIGTILAVKEYYDFLDLTTIFSKFKTRGIDINSLIQLLISYKLTENLSISKASKWINRIPILDMFNLTPFHEKTLFRTLEIIGDNIEEIIYEIQKKLLEKYDFEHTDMNFDWSSIILYGHKSKLGKYGYSRDHRPDKEQITFGLSEIREPVNIPFGFTIQKGNVPDVEHFRYTYDQVKNLAYEESLIIFDKGGYSKENIDMILADKMKYLTAKKLNKSDDKIIENFSLLDSELVDVENGVFGIKIPYPSRTNYFYFSKKLELEQLQSKRRKAQRMYDQARAIQDSIDNGRGLPKRFRINNKLVDVKYSYQTKLNDISMEEAMRIVEEASINGREGFFCLVSSEDLTLEEALQTYRKKDSIEKIINSLKNEIVIKPLRVWKDESVNGAFLIGFLSQLFISLIRYENEELRKKSTKFIKISLSNLTVTVVHHRIGPNNLIYSNFDTINRVVLNRNTAKT